MNEQIKELSDIAYKNHLARNPHSSYGRRLDYDLEFAELIIRKCVDLVVDDDNAFDILKHFGVEK